MAEKVLLNFWLDATTKEQLRELAERDGRTMSGYLRQVLNRHVDERNSA